MAARSRAWTKGVSVQEGTSVTTGRSLNPEDTPASAGADREQYFPAEGILELFELER